jgi:hypothetical protein
VCRTDDQAGDFTDPAFSQADIDQGVQATNGLAIEFGHKNLPALFAYLRQSSGHAGAICVIAQFVEQPNNRSCIIDRSASVFNSHGGSEAISI